MLDEGARNLSLVEVTLEAVRTVLL